MDGVHARWQADWERDSEGAAELSREQAYDSVFQLIDIWTSSLDVAEYVHVCMRWLHYIITYIEVTTRACHCGSHYTVI